MLDDEPDDESLFDELDLSDDDDDDSEPLAELPPDDDDSRLSVR